MNLQAITAGIISPVNPNQVVMWLQSSGYTTERGGRRTPNYQPQVMISVQIQPLSMGEIQHLDALNISGTLRGIYISGDAAGLVRVGKEGGDLFQFADPITGDQSILTWLSVNVLETWQAWTKIAVQLQSGA